MVFSGSCLISCDFGTNSAVTVTGNFRFMIFYFYWLWILQLCFCTFKLVLLILDVINGLKGNPPLNLQTKVWRNFILPSNRNSLLRAGTGFQSSIMWFLTVSWMQQKEFLSSAQPYLGWVKTPPWTGEKTSSEFWTMQEALGFFHVYGILNQKLWYYLRSEH